MFFLTFFSYENNNKNQRGIEFVFLKIAALWTSVSGYGSKTFGSAGSESGSDSVYNEYGPETLFWILSNLQSAKYTALKNIK